MCDLLKCNAIIHPVPWLTSTCTLPWMMLSRHDWLAQVRSSPPIYGSQLLLRLILVLYVLIYHNAHFRLACVNLHLHNESQSTETLLGIAILSGAAERMPDQLWASVYNMSFAQSAYYPSSKFKRRAHIQFLWEFFWPLNLFCNRYWRIPGAN